MTQWLVGAVLDTMTPPPCIVSSAVEVPEEQSCPIPPSSTEIAPTSMQQPHHPDVGVWPMRLAAKLVFLVAFLNNELLWCSPHGNPPPFGNTIAPWVPLFAFAFKGELASPLWQSPSASPRCFNTAGPTAGIALQTTQSQQGTWTGISSLALMDKLFPVDKNETYCVNNWVSPSAFIALTLPIRGEIRHARKPFI